MRTVNVHWMPYKKLYQLMTRKNLYRGKNATVKITNFKDLHAQIARCSVWALCVDVGIEPESKEAPF